jgi:transcriptional regulatory protein RtcR
VTTRLATLAPAGRITVEQVKAEIAHLRSAWMPATHQRASGLVDQVMAADATDRLDRFERVQLEDVLQVCRESAALSAAGRVLFERSRERRKLAHDADRLRTYLARFGLDWAEVKEKLRLTPY